MMTPPDGQGKGLAALPSLALRDATAADAEALSRLHRASRFGAMPRLPELHDAHQTAAWMRETVIARLTVRVATLAGAPAGYLALDGDLLDQLYVAPECQGVGVGTALLDEARRLRPNGFTLWVFQRNARARAFYDRHGLVPVEETDGAGNEEHEPDIRYAWPVDAPAIRDRGRP